MIKVSRKVIRFGSKSFKVEEETPRSHNGLETKLTKMLLGATELVEGGTELIRSEAQLMRINLHHAIYFHVAAPSELIISFSQSRHLHRPPRMSHTLTPRASACCRRVLFSDTPLQRQFRRSFVQIQTAPVPRLDVPADLPRQFWSQLSPRIRPDFSKMPDNFMSSWASADR